ncbi:hypothetical protein SAMD00019534_062370 [Acytostelium subglobosum LB1]|uniref:hypothetical protein n=1 Tax=Acytostelium subglobosum LB1 TaxID=1410327 RepID=UPI0006451E5D|nr:hypothetical protein SAMD00019534_062370 [Acytostelium subglobosum LB1]GAM23062.1 hypothetical protein SAMD00019534_062370 [Acytostelium subglobosum LB1]|eukprot:XP_012754289.1 hypothetical protein SAMD00019534_062370 [Acytostelium subglobosum LB1]
MALDLAGRIRNKERSSRAQSLVIDDKRSSSTDQPALNKEFWELLGGSSRPKDIPLEADDKKRVKDILYLLASSSNGAAGGGLAAEPITLPKIGLTKGCLESAHTYVVDCGTEVYLWVGRQTDDAVRKGAMELADALLAQRKGRPKWVSVTRVVEGGETELFKEKFADWSRSLPISMAPVPKGRIADVKQEHFDVAKLLATRDLPESFTAAVDDARGQVRVWRVKDHGKEAVPAHRYGHFYCAESYVIHYRYLVKMKEHNLIYFWQGKRSTINEKGESARLAVDLDDELGSITKKVRVVQNKEPIHFMNIFGGFIIVHNGVDDREDDRDNRAMCMYQVRSCNHFKGQHGWRAIELDEVKANNPKHQRLVYHDHDNDQYDLILCNEGNEPTRFWSDIGSSIMADAEARTATYFTRHMTSAPWMFQCSYSSGLFKIERVFEWDQEDLDNEDVMILDCRPDIYLWIGRQSTQEERKSSMTAVLEYDSLLHSSQDHDAAADNNNNSHPNVYLVESGSEPKSFIQYFHGSWRVSTKYSSSRKTSTSSATVDQTVITVYEYLKVLNRTYTLEELQNNPPRALDSTRLETYLSDDDFMATFGMDKDTFAQEKLWKQEKLKKSLGLY